MKSNRYGRNPRRLRLLDFDALCHADPEPDNPDAGGAGDPPPADAPVIEGDPPPAEGAGAAPEPEEPKRKAWWQDRIDQLTREKYEARQEVLQERQQRETLQALLGKPKDGEAAPEAPKAPEAANVPATEIERRATEIANARMAEAQHNARANAARDEGVKEHGPKFDEAIAALVQAGVELGASPFVQAALDTDAPAKVLFALGSEPEKAMRFAQMSPTKMAIEMDRLARDLASPPSREISAAPAPGPEIRGASRKQLDLADPKADLKDWMAEREKQVAARKKAGVR